MAQIVALLIVFMMVYGDNVAYAYSWVQITHVERIHSFFLHTHHYLKYTLKDAFHTKLHTQVKHILGMY